jgi:signal transduction histidine kinase
MNKQFQSLLDDSFKHYRNRQLKKALNTAQIALEFGQNGGARNIDLISANLLLARIYNTNGKYQNDPASFQKALFYIGEAKQLFEIHSDPATAIEIPLITGIIYLNQKNLSSASNFLNESLQLSKEARDIPRTVSSLCGLSQLSLEDSQFSEAIKLAEEGLQLLKTNIKKNHSNLWANVYLQLSQAYIKSRDYSRSLEMSQLLLEISQKAGDVEKEVIALRNIAVICGVKSNYKIGMQFFLEALDKCEAIGYRDLITQIQINTGTLYAHLYNYNEAIRRYQLVLDQHSDILDEKSKIIVFNNLGNIYFSIEQPDAALGYFEKAHSISVANNYLEMIAYTLAQLGRTKIMQQRFDEAEKDTEWAGKLFAQKDITNGKQIHLLNVGNLAFHKNQYQLAENTIRQAIKIARNLKDDTSEIRGYKILSSIFKAEKKFEMALEYQDRYTEIQEEYAKTQRSRQFLDMEIRHAIREKQKEIEQLTRENEYQGLLLQKSDQISRQNEELLRANEDLRQFAYVVSHDLKEPMRMIGSYTQLIQKLTNQHLLPQDLQYFEYVTDGVNRANSLLDGLLKYATIGNGNMDLEDIDLALILPICLANLRMRIQESNAEVIVHELPVVRGNKQTMVQLFQNLLSNALKFIKPGDSPKITVQTVASAFEHIIHVTDNGIGISVENQERIFKIFQRLHHRSEYEGTGIGLAICQKIAMRLGGRISVQSEPGQGATFILKLPKK